MSEQEMNALVPEPEPQAEETADVEAADAAAETAETPTEPRRGCLCRALRCCFCCCLCEGKGEEYKELERDDSSPQPAEPSGREVLALIVENDLIPAPKKVKLTNVTSVEDVVQQIRTNLEIADTIGELVVEYRTTTMDLSAGGDISRTTTATVAKFVPLEVIEELPRKCKLRVSSKAPLPEPEPEPEPEEAHPAARNAAAAAARQAKRKPQVKRAVAVSPVTSPVAG